MSGFITYDWRAVYFIRLEYATNDIWEVAKKSKHDSHGGEGSVKKPVVEDTLLDKASLRVDDQEEPEPIDTGKGSHSKKNPAYGRHRISRPMRILGPIQFWRGCVIYLKNLKKKKNQRKNQKK